MKLTANFYKAEFDSKDGSNMSKAILDNIRELAKNLQVLRDYLGKPIRVNSGYRSPRYNEKIGGIRGSYHTKGMAADIRVKYLTPKKIYNAIKKLQREGKMKKGGIGLYNGFIHYDTRGYNARWDNSSWFNFW